MPVFMKSGLDPQVLLVIHIGLRVRNWMQLLNAIWHLSDHNKDGKLSANEFAVAFHLILCVRCDDMNQNTIDIC